jgi:hypothetical protein
MLGFHPLAGDAIASQGESSSQGKSSLVALGALDVYSSVTFAGAADFQATYTGEAFAWNYGERVAYAEATGSFSVLADTYQINWYEQVQFTWQGARPCDWSTDLWWYGGNVAYFLSTGTLASVPQLDFIGQAILPAAGQLASEVDLTHWVAPVLSGWADIEVVRYYMTYRPSQYLVGGGSIIAATSLDTAGKSVLHGRGTILCYTDSVSPRREIPLVSRILYRGRQASVTYRSLF